LLRLCRFNNKYYITSTTFNILLPIYEIAAIDTSRKNYRFTRGFLLRLPLGRTQGRSRHGRIVCN
jgi:hypothetical protein